MPEADNERSPLLRSGSEDDYDSRELLRLSKEDEDNPRRWSKSKKLANVAIIAGMAILSPLASSMFTPGITQIANGLNTNETTVKGATTGFVIMLGVGPLILAPLSETFGRRMLYTVCFSVFSLLQVPTALSPNVATLIALRTLAGFFGSVGIANGGGTINDMFEPSERASVFGWYLLGPLFGPTLGPILGGTLVQRLGWRWIFWVLTIICTVNTLGGYFLLKETYAPVILAQRKTRLEREEGTETSKYRYEGEDPRPLSRKLVTSLSRPIRILSHPIVMTMSTYQALIFSTTYSLYTQFETLFSEIYGFSSEQIGLLYLGPGLGFLFAVWFLVPRIDAVYNRLTARHDGKARPEFRLPLANIGAVFLPVSLFWFAWTVQYHVHWAVPIVSTFFYGIGQVVIFNTVQNYYIDSFEKYAASAIAAGALFRSVVGGIVPLATDVVVERIGYGWGISVFGFVSLVLAPAPLLFYYYGDKIRERFRVEL